MRRDGRLRPPTDLRFIWSFEQKVIGSNGWRREVLETLLSWAADRSLLPVIPAVYEMEDYPGALEALIEREVFGKVVIRI